MSPNVYLYREKDKEFELYLGGFSTFDGLNSIDENLKVQLVSIGASNYKEYGWATEMQFPDWETVREVKSFFKHEVEFGLINFEIELEGFGILSTHDDGECHFRCVNKRDVTTIVKAVSDSMYTELIVSELLNNQGMYIEVGKSGQLKKYHSFDQYLKETKM